MKKEVMLQASKEDLVNEIIRLKNENKKLKDKFKPDPKKLDYNITINNQQYMVYDKKLYIEYEDLFKRKYWWSLEKDENGYYEDDAIVFFEYLYENYKSENIPEKIWKLWDKELREITNNKLFYFKTQILAKKEDIVKIALNAYTNDHLKIMCEIMEKSLPVGSSHELVISRPRTLNTSKALNDFDVSVLLFGLIKEETLKK